MGARSLLMSKYQMRWEADHYIWGNFRWDGSQNICLARPLGISTKIPPLRREHVTYSSMTRYKASLLSNSWTRRTIFGWLTLKWKKIPFDVNFKKGNLRKLERSDTRILSTFIGNTRLQSGSQKNLKIILKQLISIGVIMLK